MATRVPSLGTYTWSTHSQQRLNPEKRPVSRTLRFHVQTTTPIRPGKKPCRLLLPRVPQRHMCIAVGWVPRPICAQPAPQRDNRLGAFLWHDSLQKAMNCIYIFAGCGCRTKNVAFKRHSAGRSRVEIERGLDSGLQVADDPYG